MRWLAAILLLLPGIAQAQSGLVRLDDRGALLGWEAVGRVDHPGRGFCTGVLVAPRLVLTAAHCVFNKGQPVAPRDILFRAGYRDGVSVAQRRVDRIVVPPEYTPTRGVLQPVENIRYDVALLRLSADINSAEADPFRLFDDPKAGERVSVVSYGRSREEALSWQRDCSVTGRYRDGLMEFDCDVTYGSSGAPVFARQGTRARILSLVSAGRDFGGGSAVSYGMELPALVKSLRSQMRRDDSRQIGEGARRVKVGTRSGSTGARFVKPAPRDPGS